PDLQGERVERPGAAGGRAGVPAGGEGDPRDGAGLPARAYQGGGGLMGQEAKVSEEMAKKFATEKETPYTRWVRAEGLDILSAMYVPNLHTVELKPWARRGGRGVFLNHDASRTSNDCYVCEIPPGKELAPQHQLYEEMIYILDGRGSTTVWNESGGRIAFEWRPGRSSRSR